MAVAKTKQIKATQNKQRPAKQSNAKQRQIHYSKAKTKQKTSKESSTNPCMNNRQYPIGVAPGSSYN